MCVFYGLCTHTQFYFSMSAVVFVCVCMSVRVACLYVCLIVSVCTYVCVRVFV